MIKIYINGVDRSDHIENDSITFNMSVTKEPSIVGFRIIKAESKTIPTLGLPVIVEEDGENLFKGTIVERQERFLDGMIIAYDFSCKDGVYEFDRLLVKTTYQNETLGDIVQDILDNFTEGGFTLDVEDTTPTIESIKFNYEQPSKALQTLCDETGYDWYIDADDVVHVFSKGSLVAPISITDESENISYKDLNFDRNILELKNVIYVRGGEYQDPISEADAVDKYIADGEQRSFTMIYRYNDIQVKVNNIAITVGIDHIDDADDFDALYNYQEKALKFREDNKLAEGDMIVMFGNALIPLIVQAQDTDSIVAYGRSEDVKIDKSITSVQEGILVAGAILNKWKDGAYEGSFKTFEKGLRPGQFISISSDRFGIDDLFMINRISAQMSGTDRFEYKVQFLKSGETTFTDIMVELLRKDKKNITISDDEVVQRILSLIDSIDFDDEITEISQTSPPYTWADQNSMEWDDLGTDLWTDLGTQTWAELVEELGMENPIRWNFFTWSI
jgi:hypothetical protein